MLTSKRRSSPDSNKATTKKPKKAQPQSNTLFNYFESSKKDEAKKPQQPQQSSILSFFKREISSSNEEKKENLNLESIDSSIKIKSELDIQNECKPVDNSNILKTIKAENTYTDSYESESVAETSTNKATRKCPFYKRIEGKIHLLMLI